MRIPERAATRGATHLTFAEGGGYHRREWWSDEAWHWKEEYDITHPAPGARRRAATTAASGGPTRPGIGRRSTTSRPPRPAAGGWAAPRPTPARHEPAGTRRAGRQRAQDAGRGRPQRADPAVQGAAAQAL